MDENNEVVVVASIYVTCKKRANKAFYDEY